MRGCGHWIAGIVVASALGAISLERACSGRRVACDGARRRRRPGRNPDRHRNPRRLVRGNLSAPRRIRRRSACRAQVFEQGEKRFLAFILPRARRVAARRSFPSSRAPSQDADSGEGVSHSRARREPHRRSRSEAAGRSIESTSEASRSSSRLIGPTGDPYTRAYPMENVPGEDHDHPHQRSCWFTHGKRERRRLLVRGCESPAKSRRPIARSSPRAPCWPGSPRSDDWLGPDGTRVCSDERTVTFYRTQESPNHRLRVQDSCLRRPADVRRYQGRHVRHPGRLIDGCDPERRRPDHQCRGLDRRESLGKAIALGRLRRPRQREDGRHRRAQSPGELSLPDHLARANLRPLCRQSLRLARLRHARPRRLHASRPASRSSSSTA